MDHDIKIIEDESRICVSNYNKTLVILVGNEINFAIAAGWIRLYMPGGK